MDHAAADDQVWTPAGDEHFTGGVEFNRLSNPADPDGLLVLGVRFSPGARTDWHSHPGGQVLYVVSGTARVAIEAGDAVEIGAGGVVDTPAGELHWHGATPDGEMVHLSLTSHGLTDWGAEPHKVTDAEYETL